MRAVEHQQNFDNNLWINGFKGSRTYILFHLLENSGLVVNSRFRFWGLLKSIAQGSVWARYPYTTEYSEKHPTVQHFRVLHQQYIRNAIKSGNTSFVQVKDKHCPEYQKFAEKLLDWGLSISSKLLKAGTPLDLLTQIKTIEEILKDETLPKATRDFFFNASFHLCLLHSYEKLLDNSDRKIKGLAAYGILFHTHPFLENLMPGQFERGPENGKKKITMAMI